MDTNHAVKIILFAALVDLVSCTIAGLSYMDALNLVPSKPSRGEDPCKPLYWYPRPIPDYCNGPKSVIPPASPPKPPMPPPPMPVPPMPVPMPMPLPMPLFIPMPVPPPMPLPMPGPVSLPIPSPYDAPAPLSMGMPGYPPSSWPASPPYSAIQHGLSPKVDGLISPDGALNILPFTDAYSDLLERHKQGMIRLRLQNLLDEYENYPRRSTKRRCHRRNGCRRWE